MPRTFPSLVLAVGGSLLAVVGVMAQLPDDDPRPPAPPALPQAVTPGNFDLNDIQKDVPPFAADAPALAAPEVVKHGGKEFKLAPSLVGGVAVPAYGYIHQFGSFQVTQSTGEGMFMLAAMLPFPDGRRSVDFYHASLDYVGKYVDPKTRISGYMYATDIGAPVNDKRYFLFGDRNLNVADRDSNGVRWVVYYNGAGKRVYHTTARFYKP